ncbi:DUF305 domain-containing protein [Microbacterium sulfonylureivorans]|uniref:DUF305 domain-containing protein n=1 Tax=Microbacterium sulfonylureivorans TaxID=2486854 RepID=UPI000FD92236|nr:DUF305 domain-containing protein [Microbacterium sulfonylureivorans]
MRRALAAAGLVVALGAAATVVALAVTAGATGAKAPTVLASPSGSGPAEPVSEADFCFVESMIFYRVEARRMGAVLLDADGISTAAREVATDVVAAQDAEMADLREWYVAWAAAKPLERPDEGPCAGHGAHADMPGVPTWAQRTDLAEAAGADAETLFAELMLAHTAGVIDLAQDALAADPHSLVREAAEQAIADGQHDTAAFEALAARPR